MFDPARFVPPVHGGGCFFFLNIQKWPEGWRDVSSLRLRELFQDYYRRHIQGRSVINRHLGMKIEFFGTGRQKTAKGSAMYLYKGVAVKALLEIMERAEFSNYGTTKRTDPTELTGYFNFKAKIRVDGKVKHLRIATLFYKKSGKLFYNLEVNKY